MGYKVPFVDPGKNYKMIEDEIDAAYKEVMENGDLILREQLERFENKFADFVGTEYAVGLNSGYDALHISLLAAGIGSGDEVIVPAHTFLASASAIVNADATPVLVEVREDYNIDATKIEEAITRKTEAIMPVHLNGRVSEMDKVMELAEKYDLTVVEDACQALDATFNGQNSGTFGLTGCWSFYPFKILGGYGDGGAITTDDPEVAEYARLMRYNGEEKETGKFYHHGYTALLDNLQAAFLEVKLKHIPEWIERRREVAGMYKKGLQEINELRLPHFDDGRFEDVYQNYVIRTEKRDELEQYLEEHGVETLIHWPKPYYKYKQLRLQDRGFPETEAISDEVLSLPMSVELDDEQVEYVIDTVKEFF